MGRACTWQAALLRPAAQTAARTEVAALRRLAAEAQGRVKKLLPQDWLEWVKSEKQELDMFERLAFAAPPPDAPLPSAPPPRALELRCGGCGSRSVGLRFCSACRSVAYCRWGGAALLWGSGG